jgi:hypothetical protein
MQGHPLTPHEWLSQVIFYLSHAWLGLDGVVIITALVIAFTFWRIFRRSLTVSGALFLTFGVVILGMAASSLHWLTRPHIFTFLLLALWMDVLEDLRSGKVRRWWLLPVLMLVWANLHGAFLAGIVTWALYGAGAAWDMSMGRRESEPAKEALPGLPRPIPAGFWRAYLLGGVLALVATLVNPSGFGVWDVGAGFLGSRYLVGRTVEYLSPNFHSPSAWPFLVMIGVTVLFLGLAPRRQSASRVLTTAAWMVMALYSARNIPLFVIVAAPTLAGVLADWLDGCAARWRIAGWWVRKDRRMMILDRSLRGWTLPALAFGLVVLAIASGVTPDSNRSRNRFDSDVFPVKAAGWLEDHPQQGNMFNHFPWGGYLLYRFWPEQRVFIDGQTDFYGEALTRQYEQVISVVPGWDDILDRYDVGWVIIPSQGLLAGELRGHTDWQSLYHDETAQIFVRRVGD